MKKVINKLALKKREREILTVCITSVLYCGSDFCPNECLLRLFRRHLSFHVFRCVVNGSVSHPTRGAVTTSARTARHRLLSQQQRHV